MLKETQGGISLQKSRWLRRAVGLAVLVSVATGCTIAVPNGKSGLNNSPQTASTGSAKTSTTTSNSTLSPSTVIATYTGGQIKKGTFDTEYAVISFLGPIMSTGSTLPTKSQFLNEYATYFGYLVDQAKRDTSLTKSATKQVSQGFPQFITALTSQFKTRAALNQKLKSAGITESDLKNYMYDDELLNGYLVKAVGKIAVTNAQVNQYVQQNKAHYTQVHAAHILVKSLKTANLIEGKLKAGATFAAMAKQYSIDGSKSQGGDLGTATADSYVTPFANAVMTLPIGTISAPVHSQFGYHIIKVFSRTTLTSQAKQDLISQQQNQKSTAVLSKAQKAANVKVLAKQNQL